jgi:DNA-binding SARP family transcriptional activator/tetratricopeptide (TPR) repeat protein
MPETPTSKPKLELQLLGVGSVRLDGQELKFATRKLLALVTYLVLEGETPRSKLADLFWSDNFDDDARRNLRRELHRLRELGLRDRLLATDTTVCLLEPFWLDVKDFEALVKEGKLEAALELYHGELLEGLKLEGALGFEKWLETRREALTRMRHHAMLELAERLETKGDWREALKLHQQLLLEDPLFERQHREVMRLQYLLGEREVALLQFERCKQTLLSELGLEPLPETVALAERIRVSQTLKSEVEVQVFKSNNLHVPLVGRETMLANLVSNRAPMLLILGEPGVGKTRLLEEFAPNSLRLRFREISSQIPLYAVAQALREALNDPELQLLLLELEPVWQHEIARLVPEFAIGLAAKPTSNTQERSRFLEALAQALECLCKDYLVLEDLHWADFASLELIAHVLQRGQKRYQVLATARTENLEESTHTVLQSLERDGLLQRLQLEPLSAPEAQELVRAMSGFSAPDFSQRLFRASIGNPFFMLEMIRDLFERHELEVQDGVWVSQHHINDLEPRIPATVREAVLERVTRLGSATQRLLETAALTDNGFLLEEVQPATALNEWECLDGLERAVQANVLQRLEVGYGFGHDLARQALESTLGIERRRLIHGKLAMSLELIQASPARIANHLELSGKQLEAVTWRVKAAQEATRVYAHHDALGQYERALENKPPLRTAFQIRSERISVLQTLDDPTALTKELEHLNQLVLEIGDPDVLVQTQLIEAQVLQERGQFVQALQRSDLLLERRDLKPEQWVKATYQGAAAALSLARLEEADTRLEHGLSTEITPNWRGKFLIARCQIQARLGQLELAARLAVEALEAFRLAGDVAGEIEALQGAGLVAMSQGDLEAAAQALQTALELARKIGEMRFQRTMLMNLAAIYLNLGKLEAVQQNLDAVLTMPTETLDPILRCRVHYYFGFYYRLVGQLGQALEHRLEHRQLAQTLESPHEHIIAGLGVAVSLLDCGDVTACIQVLDELELIAKEHDLKVPALELQLTRIEAELLGQEAPKPDKIRTILQDQASIEPEMQVLGQILLARAYGQQDQAKEGLKELNQSDIHPRLKIMHHSTRLTLLAALKQPDKNMLKTTRALIQQDTIAPLERFMLRRALLHWLEATAQIRAAQQVRLEAREQLLELTATLEQHPNLRKSFLNQYRDLV